MAHINRIENLPQDMLREIMSRVAGQPDGAADIARAFAVSKSFHDFITDGAVLRAISFKSLLSRLDGHYELLAEEDGLVARCSRASNLNAMFILSKVVMKCASQVWNAKTETAYSDVFLDINSTISSENDNLRDLEKAKRLLDRFSTRNTDPTTLHYLVSYFLYRAKFEDLVEMQHHLKDFVNLYIVLGKNTYQYLQFFAVLDTVCNKEDPLVTACMMKCAGFDPPTALVETYNACCITTHDMMKCMGFDGQLLSALLKCSVEINDDADVVYDTMIERLNIARSILDLGSQVALTKRNFDVALTNRSVLDIVTELMIYFTCRKHHAAFVEYARGLLLARFDALSCIQCPQCRSCR